MRRRRARQAAAPTREDTMKRLYIVRVQPAVPPVAPSPKVVSLASRRQARLEQLTPKPRPPQSAA
jgi:hypothetical protein